MTFYYHFRNIYDLVEWTCVEEAAQAMEGKKTYDTRQEGFLNVFSAIQEKAWCQEQGIAYKTYYCWEKEILSEAGRQVRALERSGAEKFVEVPALPERPSVSEGGGLLAAKLRMNGGEEEIYAGAEAATVEMLVRVLRDAQ